MKKIIVIMAVLVSTVLTINAQSRDFRFQSRDFRFITSDINIVLYSNVWSVEVNASKGNELNVKFTIGDSVYLTNFVCKGGIEVFYFPHSELTDETSDIIFVDLVKNGKTQSETASYKYGYLTEGTTRRFFNDIPTTKERINANIDINVTKFTQSVTVFANEEIDSMANLTIINNPVTLFEEIGGLLMIISDNEGTVEIFNLIGKKVYSGNLINGLNKIELDYSLDSGVYMLKFNIKGGVYTHKIVLQKENEKTASK